MFRHKISRQDYLRAYWRRMRWRYLLLLVVLLGGLYVVVVTDDTTMRLIGAVFIAFPFLFLLFMYWRVSAIYRAVESKMDCEYSVDGDKLIVKSHVSESKFSKDLFIKVVKYPDYYYCYQNSHVYNLIPVNEETERFFDGVLEPQRSREAGT